MYDVNRSPHKLYDFDTKICNHSLSLMLIIAADSQIKFLNN